MTHAELLRSHANLAIKEGGMYYSGEYLSRIATVVESLEAENAYLRELLQRTWDAFHSASSKEFNAVKRDLREQGIEVDR